jgi:hypothetical protein
MGTEMRWKRWRDQVIEPETVGRLRTIGGDYLNFWYCSSIPVIWIV